MARSTKMTPAKPTAAATAPVRSQRRSAAPDLAPTATPPAKTKVTRSVPAQAASKVTAARGKQAAAAVPAAATTRVPPPSKGELRAQIEKLETANAALKAKSREANRTAKAAARRVAELEEQVAQLQAEAAQPTVLPAPPVAEAKIVRRGRPPGRRKGIDPGDAVPPGAAVQDPKPLDEEASAARDALEENLSGR